MSTFRVTGMEMPRLFQLRTSTAICSHAEKTLNSRLILTAKIHSVFRRNVLETVRTLDIQSVFAATFFSPESIYEELRRRNGCWNGRDPFFCQGALC